MERRHLMESEFQWDREQALPELLTGVEHYQSEWPGMLSNGSGICFEAVIRFCDDLPTEKSLCVDLPAGRRLGSCFDRRRCMLPSTVDSYCRCYPPCMLFVTETAKMSSLWKTACLERRFAN